MHRRHLHHNVASTLCHIMMSVWCHKNANVPQKGCQKKANETQFGCSLLRGGSFFCFIRGQELQRMNVDQSISVQGARSSICQMLLLCDRVPLTYLALFFFENIPILRVKTFYKKRAYRQCWGAHWNDLLWIISKLKNIWHFYVF